MEYRHKSRFTLPLAIKALAAAALISLPAVASATTVTAVMHAGLRVMDPIFSTAFLTRDHGYMIYDTLLGMDENFKIHPQMADWKVSEDEKSYEFFLRDGLNWHDGTPVTAEDCIASIERWMSVDGTGQVLEGMIESMEVIDDTSFRVTLSEPTGLLLSGLAKLSSSPAFMMPKRIAATPGTKAITEFIGSGPFSFVDEEFRPGIKVVYAKNPDYVPRSEPASWTAGGKQVKVDRVEWVTMPDAMTSMNALLNGEVDFLQQVPLDLLPLLESNDELRVDTIDELGNWTYLRFNHLHPPFDNPLIRQAAMLAVDQEQVLKALVGNDSYAQTCASVMGCGNPFESDYRSDDIIKPQLDKAKALLKEAEYDNTPVVILHPTDMATVSPQPVVVADALRKAGFNVQLKTMDWQSVVMQQGNQASPAEGGWNIFSTYATLATSSDPFTNTTLASNGKQAWAGWPDVPEIEALRREFATTTGDDERKRIALRINELAIDQGVVLPLGQFTIPAAYSASLHDVPHSPVTVFWSMSKSN
ncbi:ABC transporter substrate-binding protein [Paenalcaligenes niemegkensis]|uniref:ABC transporter substrate-binding protein n=1 Tax=Paenalcaligenes niemegkensis TaxID=2895469 RepID=UPI001EE889E4|nr:ABC transporter substrate-binding protein [Paenalcaligenes niemegkensis]MCQ9618208.1 ABC transporter substrate-binding protein [Paenalcaligenes niemegkensis]